MKHFEDFENKLGAMEEKLLDIGCAKSKAPKDAHAMAADVKAGKCGWYVLPLKGSDQAKFEKLTLWGASPAFMDYAPSSTLYYIESELAAADASLEVKNAQHAAEKFQESEKKINDYYGNPTNRNVRGITHLDEGNLRHAMECGRIEWKTVSPKHTPLFSSVERKDVYLTLRCPESDSPTPPEKFILEEKILTKKGQQLPDLFGERKAKE